MNRRNVIAMVGYAAASALIASICSDAALADGPEEQDLNNTLEPIRAAHGLPALAACVVQDGSEVAIGAVGERKFGSGVQVSSADQFHLGSCTKAMTATHCGLLIDRGKLQWSTPLEKHFPEMAKTMHPAYRSLTLDHLFAQRSGLSAESWPKGKSFLDLHHLPGTAREQREAYIRLILAEEPVNKPETTFVYSNRNFTVAGAIAERTGDLGWEEMITRDLFRPLGITSAGFGAMGSAENMDQPWQHTITNGKREPVPPGPLSDNPPVIAPAGRAHMAVGDWAKFVMAHIEGANGKAGLVGAETIQRLHKPLYGGDYVAGWIATDRPWGGGRVFTHSGCNNQNYAVVWMAPKKRFAVLIATNQYGSTEPAACDEVASKLIKQFLA